MSVCPACGPANTSRNHPEVAQPSVIARVITRTSEVEHENENMNHACPVHGWEHDDRRCPLIALSVPEPIDGLADVIAARATIVRAAYECVEITPTERDELVAAVRERNRYASGDYVREQSDKLAQAETELGTVQHYLSKSEERYAEAEQTITHLRDFWGAANDLAHACNVDITELEQRIADVGEGVAGR